VSLARRLLLLLRNTPSRTSVPSSSGSVWALGDPHRVRAGLYCAGAAMPRSKAPTGVVDCFAGASFGSGESGVMPHRCPARSGATAAQYLHGPGGGARPLLHATRCRSFGKHHLPRLAVQ
jgi:hypothetical protein